MLIHYNIIIVYLSHTHLSLCCKIVGLIAQIGATNYVQDVGIAM